MLLQFLPRLGQLLLELHAARHRVWVFNQRQLIRPLRAGEHAVKAVIVPLPDRVVFMVVAAGAGHRQAQKPARGRINLVVNLVVGIAVENPAQRQETQRRQPPPRQRRLGQIRR